MVHHGEEEVALALHRPYLTDQALAFVVQARIFDGDRRVRREQHGDRLVFRIELFRPDLLGEVEVAEHLSPAPDRDTEKRFHRRMVGRKAVALGVAVDIGRTDRLWLADDQAEQPTAPRRVANPFALGWGEAGGDELAQGLPVRSEHAERCIAGPHDLARRVHYLLEHPLQGVLREDRHAGRQQGLEAPSHTCPFGTALPGWSRGGGWSSRHAGPRS